MRICALVVAASLVGCGTVEYRTVEVKVPIPVPCAVPAPQAPNFARKQVVPGADIFALAAAYAAELIQREAYEDQLKAAIAGCQ